MFSEVRSKLINHYALMAMNPASIGQARLRTRELEQDASGMWSGIGQQIKEKIDELKAKEKELESCSTSLHETKT